MKLSFIIPVYKVEKFIHNCVASILNQTYKDLEVILVDDGSPDKCPKLCDEIALTDNRVKVLHKENGGLSSARNEGLKISTGEYVIFLDSDDWWSDNMALERIAAKVDQCSPDVILFSGRKYYTLDDKYTGSSTHLNAFEGEGIVEIEQLMRHSAFLACAWDKVVKRSVLVDKGISFRLGQLSEDIEWCCKLLLQNLTYAVVTGDIHVYRQQNSSSITSNISNKNFKDIKDVIERYTEKRGPDSCQPVLHFIALEYLLWLLISANLSGEEGRKMAKDMKNYIWLFQYSWYPRVRTIGKIKFLGYDTTKILLQTMYKLKH